MVMLIYQDNKKILLGTGNDIELYHDGTHSHIINNTGDLTIDSQERFIIESATTCCLCARY